MPKINKKEQTTEYDFAESLEISKNVLPRLEGLKNTEILISLPFIIMYALSKNENLEPILSKEETSEQLNRLKQSVLILFDIQAKRNKLDEPYIR